MKSLSSKLNEYSNLVILQTLSKAWGLAGLRLGMCFANADVIKLLDKVKPPYNINSFTQLEALKSIRTGAERKNQWVAVLKKERDNLKKSLVELKKVKKVYPSDANFLLVEFEDAKNMYSQLVAKGIIVRDRSSVILCANCLRITVGTREENSVLIQAIKQL